jgi:predicted Zn-dependent peptidase
MQSARRGELLHHKAVLDNGIRIITETMPQTCAVSICFYVNVGSRYESDEIAGISHFIEHLMFRGTEKRPTARVISEAVEGVGGILNGGTDRELTLYWAKVTRPNFHTTLDVLADMLLHSRFDLQDMEKERQVIMEEINMSYDSPPQRVSQLIDELLWPEHPLGRDVAGSKDTVAAITRDALMEYLGSQYLPSKTVVTIVGDIEHEEAVDAVSQAIGSWLGRQPAQRLAAYQQRPGPKLSIETRQIEQAHLCLAMPGLSVFHPERFTLDLLNVVLGEGMSSRLFCEIRDHLGLAYSISSFVDHLSDSGSLIVYAGVEPEKLPVAVVAILGQLALLREEVISKEEMAKAKEMSRGRLLLRMEDSRNVAGWLGGQETITGEVLTVDQVLASVDAINAEDVRNLARRLFTTEQLRLAVVGPVAADESLDKMLKL